MEVKLQIAQTDVFAYLKKRGYEVQPYAVQLPASEELLVSEPARELHTFTATKPGESQNEEHLYLKVFERELKNIINFNK